jgi:diguanylate cyclase (GGDEF)-like protein
MPSGRTLLLLPIYDRSSNGLGLLISVFSKNSGNSSWFNPAVLKGVLLPAAGVISANIQLQNQLNISRALAKGTQKELTFVYRIEDKLRSLTNSHSGLARLLGDSGRFLGIAYSVLMLPAKRIRISATHPSWNNVDRKALDSLLIEKLIPQLDGYHGPAVFDIPKVTGSADVNDQGYQVVLCPLFDSSGNAEGVIALMARVNGELFNDDNLRFMSHVMHKAENVIQESFDPHTGLMNRSSFEAQLKDSASKLENKTDTHCVLYLDIDNLHLVNETFGDTAGDEVITRFAILLQEVTPKHGVVARLGGDDFALLLMRSNNEVGLELASEIKKRMQSMRYLNGDKSLQVSVSIGIAELAADADREGDVLTGARMACDGAKDHGRDRVEVYDSDNHSIMRRYDDMHLVSEIQRCIDNDLFELLAQPIVPVSASNTSRRFEILLRMKDKQGNQVSSKNLFSAAERYQMMPQLDRWVISSTFRALGKHSNLLQKGDYVFAVNLSGQSLGDSDLLVFIEEEIAHNKLPPSALCFEITESAAVSNRKKAQLFIDALRKRGCRFSLDDFGAGLSSFAYLKNFKVDTLKIDGGFVRDIKKNRISRAMVAAITQVADVMGLDTVAEYVESTEIQTLVKELGVDYLQGHAVGRPMALDRVLSEATVAIVPKAG